MDVRRVDDLGRVVIPKYIRNALCISEGDELEIHVNTEDNIITIRKKES